MSKPPKIVPTPAEIEPVKEVTITQDELKEFAELLDGIQRFLMSLDFRLRQIESLIYAATEAATESNKLAELPSGPGDDLDPVD